MTAPIPIAQLIYLTGETEPEFWRRKALERAHEIGNLRRQLTNLRDALEEAQSENERLHTELTR